MVDNSFHRLTLELDTGTVTIKFRPDLAPNHVKQIGELANEGFYNGVPFHRVIGGFMAQGGDPKGDGTGGPGYTIPDECYQDDHRNHFRGTLSMANSGQRDTGGSQFFLTFRPTTHLNGKHTAFGRVIEGMDVLAKLQRIDPDRPTSVKPDTIVKAEVVRKREHAYEPTKVQK